MNRSLGIKPGDGDTDEFRRQRILFKLQHVDVSTVDFMNSIVNLYSVGHIEEVNEEYYFKVYCIMNDKDTETLSKLIAQLDIYKPAHLAMPSIWAIPGTGRFTGMARQRSRQRPSYPGKE